MFPVAGLLFAASAEAADITVHMLDVGQGDSILLQTEGGKTVLIDAGDRGASVVEKLVAIGVDHLDLVVATHPHADHVGDMLSVVQALPPRIYVDNGMPHTTKLYEGLMAAIEANPGIRYQQAAAGTVFNLGDDARLEVLWPSATNPLGNTRSDLNANSVVTRFTHGEDCILFTGDAEEPTEVALLAAGLGQCEVLKVAHHGSRHSTTDTFLAAVKPRTALISVGVGNRYHHPGDETLARLAAAGTTVYRTDRDGEIDLISTGRGVRVRTEHGEAGGALLSVHAVPRESPPAALMAASPAPLLAVRAARGPEAPAEPADVDPIEEDGVVASAAGGESATDLALPEPACPFPGSGRSEVFHAAGCGNAAKIGPQNRVCYESREAALAAGKRAAGCCHP
jgi:beta-lactamase superfamily II metal-dependent hydrolase